jgi:hypothetical protein
MLQMLRCKAALQGTLIDGTRGNSNYFDYVNKMENISPAAEHPFVFKSNAIGS